MTLDQFVNAQSRTYRRARELQKRMVDLACIASEHGHVREAERLVSIGERAWVIADLYVDRMFETVRN